MTKHIYALAHNTAYQNDFDSVAVRVFQSYDALIEYIEKEVEECYSSDFEEDEENDELNEMLAEIDVFASDPSDNKSICVEYTDLSFKIVRKELK